MPQLIIDKFNDYFVIQTLALGIDLWKPAIVKALNEIFSPRGIYERNDVPVRELKEWNNTKAFYLNHLIQVLSINENGVKFNVDIANVKKLVFP
jgi:23S rRNA (cytosine1962-C5)-methyltransferase